MSEPEQQRVLRSAQELAAGLAEALAGSIVAVVLHGSLALGSYMPGASDIDLLVVVQRRLRDEELTAVEAIVASRRAVEPFRIDVRVVTQGAASASTCSPAMELYVGAHGDVPEVEARVAGERDLVAELSFVRAQGRSLVGPPPNVVIGAVPDEWVVAYGDEVLERWQGLTDDADHAELMVLTTCRIWRFAAECVHCAKEEAGRWALARDPTLEAVTAALRRRAGSRAVVVEPDAIARLLANVRGELADYLAARTPHE